MRRTIAKPVDLRVTAAHPAPTRPAESGEARLHLEEHLASLLSPNSFETDQYRVLRHFLEHARLEKGQSVLALTSPAAGDGKTTTAINLAATLAQSRGTRVLLVDTDLRRPFVASNLGLKDTLPGLVGAIMDPRLELAAVTNHTPFNLDVVPAGPPPANAYDVLDSPRVGQLLDAARAAYDYVLLDAPPVLVVPDCRLMSQWVDGFLVVVAAHRTPRKLLAETLSALEEAKVIGIVYNGDDRPRLGYYKHYYGSYYHNRSDHAGRRGIWPWKWRRRGPGRPEPWR